MSETREELMANLARAVENERLPHVIVDREGKAVSEPYPDRESAWKQAMFFNGQAGKPLYDVRPA